MAEPMLLRGVDRAAFAVSFTERLRRAGVAVAINRAETFTRAIDACMPTNTSALYWLARTTLIDDHRDLPVFDKVFAAVFADAVLPVDPNARRSDPPGPPPPPAADEAHARVPADSSEEIDGQGLPWTTLPTVRDEADDAPAEGIVVPERLPSHLDHLADVPFEALSEADLALVGRWLEHAFLRWPTRRTRRQRPSSTGQTLALRRTLAAARQSGYEAVRLVWNEPLVKPRRLVMLCDVSQSMQAHTNAYLHLLRAVTLHADAETFAFSTDLTRLTTALRVKSAEAAIEQANHLLDDRFGGTRIAANIDALLRSHHGTCVRGAVVVIASDGWDSDAPEAMAKAMARLHRRSHRVVWLNPRMAAAGYEPMVGSMAAALPYCDETYAGNTLRSLAEAFTSFVAA